MTILGGLYARAASWRRAHFDAHPGRRRVLAHPVISIGNLAVGGSGKTPAVAAVARLLLACGERPAILSRGYGRRDATDGVVVVSDGRTLLEPVTRSGDEPQMLAQALSGVPVLVARERFLAGCLAERQFGATLHLLDDGFQHLPLARDVDLLIVSRGDLDEAMLPSGRLREPLEAAGRADALLVPGSADDVTAVTARLGTAPAFNLIPHYHPLRPLAFSKWGPEPDPRSVVAVAGVARPERFFAAVRAQGIEVCQEMRFRDHHWFTAKDMDAIARAAAATGAAAIVTTEKDAVRLAIANSAFDGAASCSWMYLPMTLTIEPEPPFLEWLLARLAAARAHREAVPSTTLSTTSSARTGPA